ESNAAVASRKKDPRLNNVKVRERLDPIAESGGTERGPAAKRREAQTDRLHLPPLPTTTIGSFPQTVEIRKARAALVAGETDKAVKGMLTGPVTILAWSFVRDDQPLADTAYQVALAIRDETVDLQEAGIAVIQVDEPALRELLPLRNSEKQAYLDWAVGSFRL